MKFKLYLIIITNLLLSSCQNYKIDNTVNLINSSADYVLVDSLLDQYFFTGDDSLALEAFSVLFFIDDFLNNGITCENKSLVVPVLINAKKFTELLILVNNSKCLDENVKIVLGGQAKYYSSVKLNRINKTYLDDAMSYLNAKVESGDSLALLDYYTVLADIHGLNFSLSKIDNDMNESRIASKEFYLGLKSSLVTYWNWASNL